MWIVERKIVREWGLSWEVVSEHTSHEEAILAAREQYRQFPFSCVHVTKVRR